MRNLALLTLLTAMTACASNRNQSDVNGLVEHMRKEGYGNEVFKRSLQGLSGEVSTMVAVYEASTQESGLCVIVGASSILGASSDGAMYPFKKYAAPAAGPCEDVPFHHYLSLNPAVDLIALKATLEKISDCFTKQCVDQVVSANYFREVRSGYSDAIFDSATQANGKIYVGITLPASNLCKYAKIEVLVNDLSNPRVVDVGCAN